MRKTRLLKMRKTRLRIALVALSLVAAAVAVPSIAGLASAADDHSRTAGVASANARFPEMDEAKAAGWNADSKDRVATW